LKLKVRLIENLSIFYIASYNIYIFLYIYIYGIDTHKQHFEDLDTLRDMQHWPRSARGQHVLYHRMVKAFSGHSSKLEILRASYAIAAAATDGQTIVEENQDEEDLG
jgi:hypothetical protein